VNFFLKGQICRLAQVTKKPPLLKKSRIDFLVLVKKNAAWVGFTKVLPPAKIDLKNIKSTNFILIKTMQFLHRMANAQHQICRST
jgi:hypothetical protein